MPESEINLKPHQNEFFMNKQLSEEMVYVLDRKLKEKFVGNNLEKPSLLLKKTFIKETTQISEELDFEKDFDLSVKNFMDMSDLKPLQMKKKRLENDRNYASITREREIDRDRNIPRRSGLSMINPRAQIDTLLNFLEKPALIIANIKPNEKGEIILKDLPLKKFSQLEIVGTNLYSNCSEVIPLNKTPISTKDITLKSNLEKNTFYSITRSTSNLSKGQKFNISDTSSTEFEIIDNIANLQRAQFNILKSSESKVQQKYEVWKFLKDWNVLSHLEKLRKYDQYSSHELNLFLYFKEKEFFKDVVQPFLKNKIEKTLIDHFLLGNKLEVLKFTEPNLFNTLANPLEKILIILMLSSNNPGIAKEIARQIENKSKLKKVPTNVFKRLFDSVLNEFSIEKSEIKGITQTLISNSCLESRYSQLDQEFKTKKRSRLRNDRSMSREGCAISNRSPVLSGDMDYSESERLDDSLRDDRYAAIRAQITKPYQNLENTREYCERNYFESISPINFTENLFWSDLAHHIITSPSSPFFSQNFIFTDSSITELIAVLAFSGVEFGSFEHEIKGNGSKGLEITLKSNCIIFQKQISEGQPEFKSDVLISQRFFDPNDRYLQIEDEPGVNYEKKVEKYLVNKIYGCKVSLTNCSIADQEFQVLIEIPEGSIPIQQIDYTKSHTLKLNAEASSSIETLFYFPYKGNFKCYPANVSKNGKVLAKATESNFEVVEEIENETFDNFESLIERGKEDDILQYVANKNIFDPQVFNTQALARPSIDALFSKKSFFDKIIAVFREKKYFHAAIWKYGLLHLNEDIMREYFNADYNIKQHFSFIDTTLLKVDTFSLFEYSPLVNPRVHFLAKEKNQILNVDFKRRYETFIKYLSEVSILQSQHYMTLVYYLLLQDRISLAIKFFDKIDPVEQSSNENSRIQYDYFAAYLDFFRGHPEYKVAREISYKYLDYPILSWRSLFVQIANYLAEYDGDELIDDKLLQKSTRDENAKSASKEEIIKIGIEGTKVAIQHQNIKEATLSFYKIDLEILFSRNPFLTKMRDDFTFIKPNFLHELDLSRIEDKKSFYEIPPELQNDNIFIQIKSENKFDTVTYFSSSLQVDIMDNYGILKVTNKDGVPISKAYVKCFVKLTNDNISFYKDGYTDIRGKFEYAALHSFNVRDIARFSILISTEENGSLIKEASPPTKMARIEDNLIIRSKNSKYDKFQNDPIQQNFIQKFNNIDL